MRTKLLWGSALALAFGFGLATQSVVGAQSPITAKNILQDPLKGGVYEETLMQVVTIAPGGVVPWHIHPDGHEISYMLEGQIVLDVDGVGKKTIKAGEGFHVQANVPHSAVNNGSTAARVLVIRLKPKDKPVMVPVKH
jgi:quercetin dioxygenase-like cupin family protein